MSNFKLQPTLETKDKLIFQEPKYLIINELEKYDIKENKDFTISEIDNEVQVTKKIKFIYNIALCDIGPSDLFKNEWKYIYNDKLENPKNIKIKLITGYEIKYLYPEIPKNNKKKDYNNFLFNIWELPLQITNTPYNLYTEIFTKETKKEILGSYIEYFLFPEDDNEENVYDKVRYLLDSQKNEIKNLEEAKYKIWDDYAKKILVSIGLVIPLALAIVDAFEDEKSSYNNIFYVLVLLLIVAISLNLIASIPEMLYNLKKIRLMKTSKMYNKVLKKQKENIYIFLITQIILLLVFIVILI